MTPSASRREGKRAARAEGEGAPREDEPYAPRGDTASRRRGRGRSACSRCVPQRSPVSSLITQHHRSSRHYCPHQVSAQKLPQSHYARRRSLLSSRASAPPTKHPSSCPPLRALPTPLLPAPTRSSLKVAPLSFHSPKLVLHSPPSVRAGARTSASMASKSPGLMGRSHRSSPGYAGMESLGPQMVLRPDHLCPAPEAASTANLPQNQSTKASSTDPFSSFPSTFVSGHCESMIFISR